MKVHEQVKHLQMTKTTIAVGTPARVAKLITESKSEPVSQTVKERLN